MQRLIAAAASLGLLFAAPAARATSPFILFFDTGSARLTPQAEAILELVPFAVRSFDPRLIEVIGAADRQGPADANLRLSRRRAGAVRDALVRGGVPPERIRIEAWGEDRPIVATADGVPEPQNRFAVIVLRDCRGEPGTEAEPLAECPAPHPQR